MDSKRTGRAMLRAHESEWVAITEAARSVGMPTARWMRDTLLEAAGAGAPAPVHISRLPGSAAWGHHALAILQGTRLPPPLVNALTVLLATGGVTLSPPEATALLAFCGHLGGWSDDVLAISGGEE